MWWQVLHRIMRAKDGWAMLLVVILCAGSLTGCLSGEDDGDQRNPIQMNVHYDATAGTITERVQNGAVLSQNGVELAFDFARVTSNTGNMETFTLDPGDDVDGSNSITVQASEQAEITYTYQTHGLFTALLTATDENENEASIELVIRIEKEIDWTQSNTDEPDSMYLPTTPDCECKGPERLVIDSTIGNTNDIFGGTPVTVTWHLDNPDGEEQAFHTEQIGEGQEASWEHNQYNINDGTWALNVSIDSGNDSLNLHHIVLIAYEAEESPPNPLIAEATTED